MNPWFTIETIDRQTHAISEYHHWEETHCYLLTGSQRSLLIDTGLGISNIKEVVASLTDRPVTAIATHVHWDHIGGHRYFPDFYAHAAELEWLTGHFPLPLSSVRAMVADRCKLPASFCLDDYAIFQGTPTRLLRDGETVDLGGRVIQALHTPGHSPGHLCFWEAERGYLFTGDLVYRGTLLSDFPSTDPAAYLRSLQRVAALPARRVFPGHHTLDIPPTLLSRMRDAWSQLDERGLLHHGGGTFDYGDWAVRL